MDLKDFLVLPQLTTLGWGELGWAGLGRAGHSHLLPFTQLFQPPPKG